MSHRVLGTPAILGASGERGAPKGQEASLEVGPLVGPRVHLSCRLPTAASAENGRTKGGGGSGAPEGIQGPRYPALPADTFGFSLSQRRRPRDPGPAPGAAASPRLPVRLCVCLCVCPAVPELASTSKTKPPGHPGIPRTLAPLPWQVSGRQAEGLRYPPMDLGAGRRTHPPGMCSDWLRGAPPFLPGSHRPAPPPHLSQPLPIAFPPQLRGPWPKGKGDEAAGPFLIHSCPPHRLLVPQRARPFTPTSLPCDRWVSGAGAAPRARAGASARPRTRPCARLLSLPLARPGSPGACRPVLAIAGGAFWPRIPGAGEWEGGGEEWRGGDPGVQAGQLTSAPTLLSLQIDQILIHQKAERVESEWKEE